MKRFVLPVAVVMVLAGAAIYFVHLLSPHPEDPAAWLPGSTILLEEMPDIHRTISRWPGTALAQILAEPEVKAFLQQPLGQWTDREEVNRRLAQMRDIDPAAFFLAVTEWSGPGAPKTVAGLSYAGNREDLDSLVDELRNAARQLWPAAKSAIETYGSGEIETFSTPSFSAAFAYRGHWLFLSTDTPLLKATLDRFDATPAADSLEGLPAFRKVLAHLPAAPDSLFFLRPALLADKAASLALMISPTADTGTGSAGGLKKFKALGMALKLDGPSMRDAAYVMKTDPAPSEDPLARDALKLSTPDTILAITRRLGDLGGTGGAGVVAMQDPRNDPTGLLQPLALFLKAFTNQGLGPEQLTQAFGPETGLLVDWPRGSLAATPLVMADVRDPAKARKYLDALTSLDLPGGIAPSLTWTHMDAGGVSLYSLPQTGGFLPQQVTLGLTPKCLIGGLSVDAVREAAARWKAGGAGLAGVAAYGKAAALVETPTSSFTYVDAKAIFDRVYGLFRSVAAMGFVPHLADYVDVAKLPAPETISRHLSPIVASGAARDGGLLLQSAGPVTTTQMVMVTALVAGAAAVPLIEAQWKGQSVAIPGFPGFASPGQSTPVPNPGNPFITPWARTAPAPPVFPAPGVPAPSASPSGGTP